MKKTGQPFINPSDKMVSMGKELRCTHLGHNECNTIEAEFRIDPGNSMSRHSIQKIYLSSLTLFCLHNIKFNSRKLKEGDFQTNKTFMVHLELSEDNLEFNGTWSVQMARKFSSKTWKMQYKAISHMIINIQHLVQLLTPFCVVHNCRLWIFGVLQTMKATKWLSFLAAQELPKTLHWVFPFCSCPKTWHDDSMQLQHHHRTISFTFSVLDPLLQAHAF